MGDAAQRNVSSLLNTAAVERGAPWAQAPAQGIHTRQEALTLMPRTKRVLRDTQTGQSPLPRDSEGARRSVSPGGHQGRAPNNTPPHPARYPNVTLATILTSPIHRPPSRMAL